MLPYYHRQGYYHQAINSYNASCRVSQKKKKIMGHEAVM